jgi:hypothetical protein
MMFFFSILFYLINLICVSISIIFCLNKKDILIKTFSKHYRVYVSSFEIKYFDVYLSLDFQVLFLDIVNDFLFIYWHI